VTKGDGFPSAQKAGQLSSLPSSHIIPKHGAQSIHDNLQRAVLVQTVEPEFA
jgi:hypothetical protein